MQATTEHMTAIARLLADGHDVEPHAKRLEQWHAADPELLRVAVDGGEAVAFLRVYVPTPDHYWLPGPRVRPGADAAAVVLAHELVDLGRRRGWTRLSTRLDRDTLSPIYRAGLEDLGFAEANARVEYKTPIAALPDEGPTPFEWVALDRFGRARTAALVDLAGPGPEWEPEDTGDAVIAAALGRRGMYCAPDCVQVGLVDGEPAAFVIAQVEPASGWSTITFMGVAPAFRGRGLGRFVHRRGMAMLRAQGGTLYHGGTSETNRPMVRLFEAHGCRVHARLVEFSLSL